MCKRFSMHRTSLLVLVLLGISVRRALCQDPILVHGRTAEDRLRSTGWYYEYFTYWDTDQKYIKTGDNKAIPAVNSYNVTQLNSLRCFKKHKRNCYTLPAIPSWSYNVKASFYYGNYDGRLRPPTFGLEIEGIEWTSVVTSSTRAMYHEAIYTARRYNVSVCLVRAKGKHGNPFINALEMLQLSSYDMYNEMNHDLTWFSRYRYSFGADEPILGYPGDSYNRVWEPVNPSSLNQVSGGAKFFYHQVNGIPNAVLNQAVEAKSPNNSVNLQLTFNETNRNDLLYYMTFYFTSMHDTQGMGGNSFDLYVGNVHKTTIETEFYYCTCWTWANVHLNGTMVLSIDLRPNGNTSFPPAISAMEVLAGSSAPPIPEGLEKKRRNLGLILGLSVGLVLGLPLLVLLVYFIVLRRPRPAQGRLATPAIARNGAMHDESQPAVTKKGGDLGQVFDQEEVDELLYLHCTTRTNLDSY